jgi:hypothetical protein
MPLSSNGKEVQIKAFVHHRNFGFGIVQRIDVHVPGGGKKVLVKWDHPGGPGLPEGGISSELLEVCPFVILGSQKRPHPPKSCDPGPWVPEPVKYAMSRKEKRAARLKSKPHLAHQSMVRDLRNREALLEKRVVKQDLEEIAFVMKEVESAEALAAERRLVKTTALNVQRQLSFAFQMQNKALKEEEKKKVAKAAAAKKEEEEERNIASHIFFMKKREARLKALNEELAKKEKEEMTKFIKDTAAGIVKSVIDAILVHAAEYDAVLANAAAQKERERKKYLDMQERKADADDRMWVGNFAFLWESSEDESSD